MADQVALTIPLLESTSFFLLTWIVLVGVLDVTWSQCSTSDNWPFVLTRKLVCHSNQWAEDANWTQLLWHLDWPNFSAERTPVYRSSIFLQGAVLESDDGTKCSTRKVKKEVWSYLWIAYYLMGDFKTNWLRKEKAAPTPKCLCSSALLKS